MSAVFLRAWRYLTWRHWGAAAAVGVTIGILIALEVLHLNFFWTPWKIVFHTPLYVAFVCVFLFGIAVVESSAPGETSSLWRYLLAALAASAVCLAMAWTFADSIRQPPRREVAGGANSETFYSKRDRRTSALFAVGVDGVLHCWLATFIYVRLRNSRLAAMALAHAQMERAEASRMAADSQLDAVKARIDPAFLSQTLQNIERTYGKDPARGDILLDELIEFLRAAIPTLRLTDRPGKAR
jgi:hypothetical protein